MAKKCIKSWGWAFFLVGAYIMVLSGSAFGQVVPGTVNAKVLDGVGNKITSTVSGPDTGLDVNCLNCGAGGATYLDADGIVNQTASAVHGQTYMYNGVTWDRIRGDTTNGMWVNCKTGCSAGTLITVADAGNSTLVTLAGGGNFTGAAFDLTNYASWSISVFSDKASSANGFTIEWSEDNVNWGAADVTTYVSAQTNMASFGHKARYVRVNYTNSGVAQVTFRVYAWAHPFVRQTRKFVGNALEDTDTAQIVISSLQGHTTAGGGAWVPVKVNPSGALTADVTQSTSPWVVSGTIATSNAFLLDATFTGRFAAAYVDADAVANQTTTAIHGQSYFYNGVTWDRMRGTIAGGLLVDVSDAFLLDATFTTRINTLGQKAMAASTPVVLASDQTSIPVAATVSNAFLLDATFTGRFPVAYVDADTIANQTTTAVHGQCYLYNGVTWDRCRGAIATGMLVNISNATLAVTQSGAWVVDTELPAAAVLSDAIANPTTPTVGAATLGFNGVTFERVRTQGDAADAVVTEACCHLAITSHNYGYNGATWDRLRSTIAGGLLVDVSDLFLLDATVTNRFPAGSTPADNESNAITATRFGNYSFVFDGVAWDRWTGAVTQSGTWNIGTVTTVTTVGTLTTITNPVTVLGNKTNNNAAPGATNVGVLPCVATAVAPTHTEGNQVGCSGNLSGATRVINESSIATANNDGACASGAASFTAIVSNASRTWLAVWASPANTDDVYLKLGATATAADARFAPGQPLNFTSGRIYTGIIDAFPASGTQAVCVMELN